MTAPLVAPRWRPLALATAVFGVLVVAVLAAVTFHSKATRFDAWALRNSADHIGDAVAHRLLDISSPALDVVVVALIVLAALVTRRWHVAAFAVVAPVLAVIMTELVLKPLIARPIGVPTIIGSFPSGHETGVASTALVVAIAAGQLRLHRWARVLLGVVLVLWAAAAATGLVRNLYHYATDTFGGIGVALAVVPSVALSLNRWNTPHAQGPILRRRQLTRRS